MFGLIPSKRKTTDLPSLFDDFFNDDFFNMVPVHFNTFKTDIRETDKEYIIESELPGFKKEDIQLGIDNDYLIVRAEKNEEKKEEKGNYIRRERYTGKMERRFYIGDVEQEKINAEYNDGILKILLPKKEQVQIKKQIPIT
jgi:HSP20 family protein